ncbi:MAG: CvpA family protein [Thermoleophilaceae bacterium]
MLILDLLIAGIIVGAAVWGYQRGLLTHALALVGFGAGAILGSRVAPLVLDGGLRDPFAPVLALPAALLCGAIVGMALERFGFGLRRRLPRRGRANAVGGALLAACVGLVTVWILGALAARVDSFRQPVRDSAIIERLNAVLPPPGPLLNPIRKRIDPLPILAGPRPNVGPPDPRIKRDRQVRSAADSTVKVHVKSCGRKGTGSGWVARDGTVVTNAHVVQGSDEVGVQVKGKGDTDDAEVIGFDEVNDVAVLRAPAVAGVPALRLDPKPAPDTQAAALGFPGGGPFKITPVRLGTTARIPGFKLNGRKPVKRRIVILRAKGIRPGSSGSPIVDRGGRVVTMVFAGRVGGSAGYGVPNPAIRRTLRRADSPVDTGSCEEE